MRNAYLLFSLFAATTAFNLGVYLLVQAIRRQVSAWFPAATIVFGLCLFFSCYEVGGYFVDYPFFLWWNAPLLFLIGPFAFLHICRRFKLIHSLHFLPFLAFLVLLFPTYLLPLEQKRQIILSYYNPDTYDVDWLQYLYLLHIGVYCLWGFILAGNRSIKPLYLILGILACSSFLCSMAFDYAHLYLGKFSYYTLALLTCFTIGAQFYFSYRGFEATSRNLWSLPAAGPNRQLFRRMTLLLQSEGLYRDPELKLGEVANLLKVSPKELSLVINRQHGKNFRDYLNRLRVEEVKTALLDPANRNLTYFAIARTVGFQSNSTFYRVFRKYAGCTPKQFVRDNRVVPKPKTG